MSPLVLCWGCCPPVLWAWGEREGHGGLGGQGPAVCGQREVRKAGGGGCLHGPGLRWWTGNYGCAGLAPLLPRVGECHHNSDVGRVWPPRACRTHGGVLQHVFQSHRRWRQGNSFCLGVRESRRDKTLFVAAHKQRGLQSWGWGAGGPGSGARWRAQPGPALSRWQPQSFRQVSLDPVFHFKIKNLPLGENKKEIVW